MPDSSPQKIIEALRAEIREHDRRYYVDAAPTVGDQEYDAKLAKLRQLEGENPELLTADSPTQRVGGEPLGSFQTVEHAQPMYSIDNSYDAEELTKWAKRCYETVANGPTPPIEQAAEEGYRLEGGYSVEPKIDGVAASLRYEEGRFVLGVTRGDGKRGDDITQNLRTLRSVPLELIANGQHPIPKVLEVRGEVYMPNSEFIRLNELAEQEGNDPYVNPRNACAGALKQLDPAKVATRGLRIIIHGKGQISDDSPIASQQELLQVAQTWGLPTNPLAQVCSSIHEVLQVIEAFDEQKSGLGYGVDGVVIKVNRYDLQEELGFTSRFPRWCMAYKYAAEQVHTKLLAIDWQIGKTGKLTPRARMSPVFVAGTTVQHASLHNVGEMRRKDLRLGDEVVVEKAGEIIPQVVKVVDLNAPDRSEPVEVPNTCPWCDSNLFIEYDQRREHDIRSWQSRVEREKDRAKREKRAAELPLEPPPLSDLDESGRYCPNPECPAQLKERLCHYVARGQMDIDGLGEKVIEQLLEAKLVKGYGDLYRLKNHREALLSLERMGEKKVNKLIASIEESKTRGLASLLASLTIRQVGSSAASILAKKYLTVDAIAKASVEELETFQVDGEESGIGTEIARSVHDYFHSERGQAIIEDLQKEGVVMIEAAPAANQSTKEGPFAGKTFVITGTLSGYSRNEAQKLIVSHGGKATSSISASTNFLLAGEKAGSKLAKAEKLGVTILDEATFVKMLEENQSE